ncbi:MAG TPA: hypothetical protein VG733_11175 [Chthoniobacteraceae bacterium]|nr:hypothetical protein [Chthoniobacteraceae bacterium]
MPRGTRKLQINRQQKHILLLALFLLKHAHRKIYPLKRDVIGFIDSKNLMLIRDEDRKKVATGEEAWENKIAFRRADLKEEGCIAMPDIGIWQITPAGEKSSIEWCVLMNEFATRNSDWEKKLDALESIFFEKIVITRETVLASLNAFEIAKRVFPDDIPQLSPEQRSSMDLLKAF